MKDNVLQLLSDSTNWLFLAISAYVFMRAFQVVFAGSRERAWCRVLTKIVAVVTLVTAGLAFMVILADSASNSRKHSTASAAQTE